MTLPHISSRETQASSTGALHTASLHRSKKPQHYPGRNSFPTVPPTGHPLVKNYLLPWAGKGWINSHPYPDQRKQKTPSMIVTVIHCSDLYLSGPISSVGHSINTVQAPNGTSYSKLLLTHLYIELCSLLIWRHSFDSWSVWTLCPSLLVSMHIRDSSYNLCTSSSRAVWLRADVWGPSLLKPHLNMRVF